MERRVDICVGEAPVDVIEGSRDPEFMSVDQMPSGRFRFRFKQEKQGHDDWFLRLTNVAKAFNNSTRGGTIPTGGRPQKDGRGPSVTVMERIYDDGVYYQNQWGGSLGMDSSDCPCVVASNTALFQFDLKHATFTQTRLWEESMPESAR